MHKYFENKCPSSEYNFYELYRILYWKLFAILRKETLSLEGYKFTGFNKIISLSQIQEILHGDGLFFSDDEVQYMLQFLIFYSRTVIRYDFLEREPYYKLVNPDDFRGTFQSKHLSFINDSSSSVIVVGFMTDTHIGNAKIFNPKLVDNFYNYIIMCGAKRCFHMGDLFSKIIDEDKEAAVYWMLELFYKYYPKPSINEIITYGMMGNHEKAKVVSSDDCTIDGVLNQHGCDLRAINCLNPSFFMLPRQTGGLSEGWHMDINDSKFWFHHRVFSGLLTEHKIDGVDDFSRQLEDLGDLYKLFNCDVSIFGHMHTGFILSADGRNYSNEKLFLGVPSTSSLNIGNAVGYLLYIYPEDNSMEVAVLFSDDNLNVYERERFVWYLGRENNFYKREYKKNKYSKYG